MKHKSKKWLVGILTLALLAGMVPMAFAEGADAADGHHTAPPEAELSADSLILTHEVMPDTWVFTDGLGRESLTNVDVGDPRDDKTVAMFYWTWHTSWKDITPINKTEILAQYPEALHDYDHPAWAGLPTTMFWNEPIWGYYGNDDAWVMRRQGEMLANAGIDTILTDNTNSTVTWSDGYRNVLEAWADAKTDGVRTPKMSFMLPFAGGADTATQLRSLYGDIFRDGEFQDQWFYWDGKPFMMANVETAGLDAGDPTDSEILNFFTYRTGNSSYGNGTGKKTVGAWGWLSISPQEVYYARREDVGAGKVEQTTVGVAMNHSYKYNMLAAMNGEDIMGRSYTTTYQDRYKVEGKEASKWGYNFAEQWENALKADPKIVLVTGWNEWIAGRYPVWPEGYASAVENAFPDQGDDEFSRDLEPSKGALQDHYYYQLVNNVRRFKGVRAIPTPSEAQSIDLSAGNGQWATAEPYYAAYIGNTDDRDAIGYGSKRYTEYSGRNDIIGARVARDDEFIYFYVECNDTISPHTDPLWMNLYIDSNQENAGWNTFDYVLNKTAPTADRATLERFTGNGYDTEVVGQVDYRVDGQYMQVQIPKALLNLTGYDFTVNFSWTDNVHDADDAAKNGDVAYTYTKFSGDIMDFYTSGDVAPGGRFKYSYISTGVNAGVEEAGSETTPSTETESSTETARTEESETAQETTELDETTQTETVNGEETMPETSAPKKDGCGSVLGIPCVALVASTAALCCVRHRKKKREGEGS